MPGPTKREVVVEALSFRKPPYVPWAWTMTERCAERMKARLGGADRLDPFMDSHFFEIEPINGRFETVDQTHVRDTYGVIWDRSVDKDLDRYEWPDVARDDLYAGVGEAFASHPHMFRRYQVGFSLYERAWTMRGMTDLLMDMVVRPEFVERLLDKIVESNLRQVRKALTFDIDAVYFGDDYGMQTGLIMGVEHWRHFFKPRLARMFGAVREAGKFAMLHSCGRVTQIFDDLVEVGLNCFNPFQPEVMDVFAIKKQYHGRLAFHGGMSIQKVLPFGTPGEVRRATQKLLDAGRQGGYIFSPAHAVPGDVPPENLIAMMEVVRAQPGLA